MAPRERVSSCDSANERACRLRANCELLVAGLVCVRARTGCFGFCKRAISCLHVNGIEAAENESLVLRLVSFLHSQSCRVWPSWLRKPLESYSCPERKKYPRRSRDFDTRLLQALALVLGYRFFRLPST